MSKQASIKKISGTRTTGTVHTCAKACLTSATTSVPPPGKSVHDDYQNLIICSLVHCQPPLKIHGNPFGSFCTKSITDKQKTNNDGNITSLAEVKI